MMRRLLVIPILVSAVILLTGTGPASAQSFGKNKVNYTAFDWRYIPTKNFDIYYTDGGYEVALIASELAEESYEQISAHWDYTLKRRIPILIYNSHNDFSQTNVVTDIIEESVGGFTELFKNRVVLPWEGSLSKFKHVVHHELTHAIMFDMLYGGVIDSIVGREYLFQMPLWFAEGIAEHESQYWSTEGDMIVRDGIITGYLPPIQQTSGGYLVYKGGESFFKYLQENYGTDERWVVGELLHSLQSTKNFEKTFKAVLGVEIEELSKEWQRQLRAEHWPDVKDREIPEDFSTQLTDHTELENYINSNPSFNPTGDKIAFLTDRNEYMEIMIMSAIDGRLLGTVVRGEKAGEYEEMHWTRGGITWSHDGSMIAFSSKAGAHDAIHIAKVGDGGFDKVITPDMDAVYSPDWSPDDSKILFCGISEGKLDLYTVDIATGSYSRLTNDYFDEFDPRWSPDGTKIAFASDRIVPPYELTTNGVDDSYSIFVMNADGTDVRQITSTGFTDLSPDWTPDGAGLVFTSDLNGITNLYHISLDSLTVTPLTNLLTGSANPDWSPDGTQIAYSSFEEGGWDIFLLKRPLRRQLTMDDLTPTAYREKTLASLVSTTVDSSAVMFSDRGTGQELSLATIDSKPYKIKFSPDSFNAFASYDTFMGFGGMGSLSLSDVMGNHRINLAGDLYYSLEESNFMTSYYYLKRQTNIGVGLFHYKTYYRSSNWDLFSDRLYGAAFLASRPFSKFTRLDFSLNYLTIERDAYTLSTFQYYDPYSGYTYPYGYTQGQKLSGVRSLTTGVQFVKDTALWGYTGPVNGSRSMLDIEYSPPIDVNDLTYTTIEADYRRYFRFGHNYSVVTRLSGGSSFGKNPRLFFLGGIDGWLNTRVASVPGIVERSNELFFSRYPFPLRGYDYYEFYGRNYFLTNFEFRFPFIRYLALGWPLPLVLGDITGTIFTDIGSAWNKTVPEVVTEDGEEVVVPVVDSSFHGGGRTGNGSFYLDDIKMTWGVGMRINLGFTVLRLDTAWRAFLRDPDPSPIFYLSFGPDF